MMVFDLPNSDKNPQASHTQKLIPTEPVLISNPDGDTNIPDPIEWIIICFCFELNELS